MLRVLHFDFVGKYTVSGGALNSTQSNRREVKQPTTAVDNNKDCHYSQCSEYLFSVASNNDVCSLLCTFPDSMPYRTNVGPVLALGTHHAW